MTTEYKEIEGIDASTYAGKAAKACKLKARGTMGDDLLIFTLLDFISLMLINNKFLSKGITITDDNREESYIKIIETGDDSLILELEKFIHLKDNIQQIESKKKEYQEMIEKLQLLSDYNDETNVNSIVEEYLRR
jgi:hypothetical protein